MVGSTTEGVAARAQQASEEKEAALRHSHEKIRTLIGEGKLSEALSACDALLTVDVPDADSLFLKALVLYLQGNHRQAEPLVIEAIAANSFTAEYYTLLSGIYQRKGLLEEANHIADRGLAVQSGHIPSLQVKALALIRLFRLQEAHSVVQKIQRMRHEFVSAPEPWSIAGADPEILYEQALTIDPFRTKPRLESLDGAKAKTGSFRFVGHFLFGRRIKTILGLSIIIGLIMTVTFFFRDNATYKAFSLLILAVLLGTAGQQGVLSVSTNLPLFFPRAFRSFLQRRDIRLAVYAVIAWLIVLAAFAAWHYQKSYIGLTLAVIAATYLCMITDNFSDGSKLTSYLIPGTSRKKTTAKKQPSTTSIPLADAPYHSLYHLLRKSVPGNAGGKFLSKFISGTLKYGMIFLAAYPVLFLVAKLAGAALHYKILLIPELAVLFCVQLLVSMSHIMDLPLLFPAGARKFIPPRARRSAYVMMLFQVLLAVSFALWLAIDNAHVLWVSGVLQVIILRKVFSSRKRDDEASLPKAEMLDYIKHHHKAFKNQAPAGVTQSPTTVSAAGSAEQRSL